MATARRRTNAADRLAAGTADVFGGVGERASDLSWRAQSEVVRLRELAAREVRSALSEAGPSYRSRRAAVERALEVVDAEVDRAYGRIGADLAKEVREVAVEAHKAAADEVDDLFGAKVAARPANQAKLRELADGHELLGDPPDEWLSAQAEDAKRRLRRELRVGLGAREDDAALLARVQGAKTGRSVLVAGEGGGRPRRVAERSGGAFSRAERDAGTVADTAVQGVAQESASLVWEGNRELFAGLRAVIVLDGRTSKICIARTGAAWDWDGEPLEGSTADEPFPGDTPWHPN